MVSLSKYLREQSRTFAIFPFSRLFPRYISFQLVVSAHILFNWLISLTPAVKSEHGGSPYRVRNPH